MKNITLIGWDMDGVKYPITPEFQDAYKTGIAKAACKLIQGMTYDEALEIADQSTIATGKSAKFFTTQYGLDYLTLNPLAEQEIDLSCIQPNHVLLEKIQLMKVEHAILTEANEIWKNNILTRTHLLDFYAERIVITKEHYPNDLKQESKTPFLLLLERTGHEAKNTLIPEDNELNLIHPHEMGMTTVLICNDPHKKQKSHIDYLFPKVESFVDFFLQQTAQPL